MGEPSRDVMVRTRFADAPMLMASLDGGITRGALRLPAAIAVGATFELSIATVSGEVAAKGTAEAIRADGTATLVRFLSATDDGGDHESWIDLAGAVASVPQALTRRALPPLVPMGKRGRRQGAPPPPPVVDDSPTPIAPMTSIEILTPDDATAIAASPPSPPALPPRRDPTPPPRRDPTPPRAETARPRFETPSPIVYPHAADMMSPPSVFPLPPGASITIPPPLGGTATTIALPFGASITIPPAMGNTIPPPMGNTIPPPMGNTIPPPMGLPIDAPPPPARAARGMLGASVVIAAAGAIVAASAVLWARSVSDSQDRADAPRPRAMAAIGPASLADAVTPTSLPKPAPPPPPAPVKVAVAVTPPAPAPAPAPAPVVVAPPPAPAPAKERAAQTCRARITSNADGAAIFIDGARHGDTPATLELPCTAATLVLKHPRYQVSTRRIEPTPDGLAIDASMIRPKSQLKIVSRPAGATVTLGRRTVGKTPLTVAVDGYEKQSLVVSAPGYDSERRTVYVRGDAHVVTTTLRRR